MASKDPDGTTCQVSNIFNGFSAVLLLQEVANVLKVVFFKLATWTLQQSQMRRAEGWKQTQRSSKNSRHKQLHKACRNTQTFSTWGKERVNHVNPFGCSPPHITSVIQGPTRLVRWTLINLQRTSPTIDNPPLPFFFVFRSFSLSLSPALPSPAWTVYHFTHGHFCVRCTFAHKNQRGVFWSKKCNKTHLFTHEGDSEIESHRKISFGIKGKHLKRE